MTASHSIMLAAIYVMTVAIFSAVVGAPEWGVILSLCAWVVVVISSICAFFEWRDAIRPLPPIEEPEGEEK